MNLLNEEECGHFMKTSTPEDIEVLFNSIILIKKHNDMDVKITKEYVVKLYDTEQSTAPSYLVSSNAIGLEAIRRITLKHKIQNGGSESDTSRWFSFSSI